MKYIAAILAVCALLPMRADAGNFGTGFAISSKGYLITCHHVVRNAQQIVVHTSQGAAPAIVIALDPKNDLAILKVEDWQGNFLGLSSASEVSYASEVTAAGFPDPSILGVNPKVSKGIVNAMSGVRDDPRFLQVSAPVQPGNSGGPLISASGRVVGIIASGLNSMDRMAQGGYVPQSVNYAIKTDLVFPLLKSTSVSTRKFGTRTKDNAKQVNRALSSIALIEGITHPRMHGRPAPPRPAARQNPAWIFPQPHSRPFSTQKVQMLPAQALPQARNDISFRPTVPSPPAKQHTRLQVYPSIYLQSR